jgi:hypothetical protein
MGPVGVGKTFLATALGHAAIRRRYSVHFERCGRLLKRLRSSRLDNSHDAEMRKLLRVDLLIIDLCRGWGPGPMQLANGWSRPPGERQSAMPQSARRAHARCSPTTIPGKPSGRH